jgi:hypothetical protein
LDLDATIGIRTFTGRLVRADAGSFEASLIHLELLTLDTPDLVAAPLG